MPVLAHPATASRGQVITEDYLADLVRAGLFGLELDHRENTVDSKAWLRRQARRYGLVLTGSSDYHVTGKPNQLGENRTTRTALDRIVREAAGHPVVV